MQETLLNLLLRNYLHYNLYDQAEKLRSKAPRFEAHSNQQVFKLFCFTLNTCIGEKMGKKERKKREPIYWIGIFVLLYCLFN